jgi:hypothetical protein
MYAIFQSSGIVFVTIQELKRPVIGGVNSSAQSLKIQASKLTLPGADLEFILLRYSVTTFSGTIPKSNFGKSLGIRFASVLQLEKWL